MGARNSIYFDYGIRIKSAFLFKINADRDVLSSSSSNYSNDLLHASVRLSMTLRFVLKSAQRQRAVIAELDDVPG